MSGDSWRELEATPGGRASLPPRGEVTIRGAYVISMDPGLGDLRSADIRVRDGLITQVGERLDQSSGEEIDARGMIALPGFVDTHWHLWNSSLRGIIDYSPERSYFPVKHVLGPLFRPIDTYRSVRLGLAEALLSGITTVHNWDHNLRSAADADANLQAHIDSGGRARFGYGTPDGLGSDQLMDLSDLERVRSILPDIGDSRLTLGIVARGPARTGPEVFTREWAAARSLELPISMHLGGSRDDASRYASMEVMRDHGLLGRDVQLVHAVEATEDDMALMAETGTSLSVSPITSLRSMGFPKIGEMLRAGVLVSLSIDTLAAPTSADFFAQMKVAYSVERSKGNVAGLDQRRVLRMATIDGARDLGLEGEIGSLTPGKRADMLLIDARATNLAPCADPVDVIVNAATPANVKMVMVDGRILMSDGRLIGQDEVRIARDATETLRSLCERAGWEIPWSPFATG